MEALAFVEYRYHTSRDELAAKREPHAATCADLNQLKFFEGDTVASRPCFVAKIEFYISTGFHHSGLSRSGEHTFGHQHSYRARSAGQPQRDIRLVSVKRTESTSQTHGPLLLQSKSDTGAHPPPAKGQRIIIC